jgi:hypothetical protein
MSIEQTVERIAVALEELVKICRPETAGEETSGLTQEKLVNGRKAIEGEGVGDVEEKVIIPEDCIRSLAKKIVRLNLDDGMEIVRAILKKHKASKIGELKEEQYASVIKDFEKEIANEA